jgi:hypothetical protein
MPTAIDRFRDISRHCAAGAPLPADLAAWLTGGLARFLDRRAPDLDRAFGLVLGQGGVPWWREEAIRRRDAELRRYAALAHPLGGVTQRARAVARALQRYAAGAWRFERDAADVPAPHVGRAEAHLWRAFKAGAAMPLGERQLRTILAG